MVKKAFTFSCQNGANSRNAARRRRMKVMDKDHDINSDKDPVTAVERKEKELAAHDLERARGGNDLAEQFGRQNIGPTAANKQVLENKKKEDEKFEHAVRQLLQQMREELERRLKEFDRLIAESNAKIDELKEEIETTETLLEELFGKDWKEKLKKGELDANDPLLRQWLMQQQELKDYLERREKLIKERDELEKQITEIEGSNLPDHRKLDRIQEILERGTSAGVHKVWQSSEVIEQVREVAAHVHTDEYTRVESQEADSELFAGVSFAAKAGIGDGTEASKESLRVKFAEVAAHTIAEEPRLEATAIPTFKGPKVPG